MPGFPVTVVASGAPPFVQVSSGAPTVTSVASGGSPITLVAAGAPPLIIEGFSPGPAPTNSVAPAVTGTRLVGSTVTVGTGTWANTPTSYTYQKKRYGVLVGTAQASPNFVLDNFDAVEPTLKFVVNATNLGGTTAAETLAITDVQFPNGVLIVQGGDSIFQQGTAGYTAGATAAGKSLTWTDIGELNQVYQADPRFNHDSWPDAANTSGTAGFIRYANGSNQGWSGQSSADLLARISSVLAWPAPLGMVNIGVNDNNGTNSLTLAQTKANITAIADAFRAAGKRLILGTPRPELRAGYLVDTAAVWAWAQTTFGPGTSYPEVVLWDAVSVMTADGPVALDFRDSDLHPGTYGTQGSALGATNTGTAGSLLAVIRSLVASGDRIATNLWPLTSYGTNPTFTGSTAAGTGFTGSVQASWSVIRLSGTFTGVASLEANSDTGGQTAVLDITPAGAGTQDIWRMQLAAALSGSAATAVQSKWMSLIVEVEHDGSISAGPIYAEITCSDADYIGRGNYTFGGVTNPLGRQSRGALRHWIRTAPILMPAILTTVQTAIYGYVMSANGLTPYRVKVRRARLVEVGDPRTAWGL